MVATSYQLNLTTAVFQNNRRKKLQDHRKQPTADAFGLSYVSYTYTLYMHNSVLTSFKTISKLVEEFLQPQN